MQAVVPLVIMGVPMYLGISGAVAANKATKVGKERMERIRRDTFENTKWLDEKHDFVIPADRPYEVRDEAFHKHKVNEVLFKLRKMVTDEFDSVRQYREWEAKQAAKQQ